MLGKKAMNPGEIFVYVMSLLIVAFILIFGYMSINDFIGNSSDVEMLQFQKTMEQYVRRYSTEYGSQGFGDVPLPGNIMKLCFLEYYNQASNIIDCEDSGASSLINPVVKDSYGSTFESREKKNFFLIDSKGNIVRSYYLGNLTVSTPGKLCNHLCIDNFRGKLSFTIKGQGVSADISKG
jgi:hypothetical protein